MQPPQAARAEPVPAFDLQEDVEIETGTGETVSAVDLTRPLSAPEPSFDRVREPAREPTPQQRAAPERAVIQEPVTHNPQQPAQPRQSARQRTVAEPAVTAGPEAVRDDAGLPATRRGTAPDVAHSTVREVAGEKDTSKIMKEVEILRREVAELRREVRDLREAGPGGLGPVERAVQRLAQRMDRVDGGAQPLIADGQLEQRKPRKSGFFGLFSGRR